jgi:hypothetical protein
MNNVFFTHNGDKGTLLNQPVVKAYTVFGLVETGKPRRVLIMDGKPQIYAVMVCTTETRDGKQAWGTRPTSFSLS